MPMLDWALRYAALGWFVFPLYGITVDGKCGCGKPNCKSPGKHPRIKWKQGASCDEARVRGYWTRWPNAGIGCATGPSGLLVADADGTKGVTAFRELVAGEPGSLMTARARTARGAHIFFRGEGKSRSNPDTKLDTRGVGGYVVLAPSPHVSGHVYRWEVEPFKEGALSEAPPALVAYSRGDGEAGRGKRGTREVGLGSARGDIPASVPPWLASATGRAPAGDDFTMRLSGCLVDWSEVDRALERIPPDCCMDEWIRVGMALHSIGENTGHGLERWSRWSARGQKYREDEPEYKWTTFNHVPDGVGLGSLFVIAQGYGYQRGEVMPPDSTILHATSEIRPPSDVDASGAVMNGHQLNRESQDAFFQQFNAEPRTNPLIRLNKDYAVIGNVGGKCLVLSWENSPIDEQVRIPAFQSFKSFSERFGNEYIPIKKVKHLKGGDEEYEDQVQLGAYWLRWPERRTYEGIELAPNREEVLPNGNYNLWQGFGVEPKRGDWSLMQRHIEDVLAKRNSEAVEYITNYAAWSVQHPGERAEAALVSRGDKGVGKGMFFGTLRQIFGGHGLQIFNRAHLVGNFNAHRRNCLFMFADEAFWAGDKQGESVLKGLITEPVFMLEQKGVDAIQWPNKIKLCMAANADLVVPASHDERRYAVFDISRERIGDRNYFSELFAETRKGGISAMLYDMLRMDLGDWHPRHIPQTEALQEQKAHSLPPIVEWWEGVLQGGANAWEGGEWSAGTLFEGVRNESPATKNISDQRIAAFLKQVGATKRHTDTGSKWKLPALADGRRDFERKYGKWKWD